MKFVYGSMNNFLGLSLQPLFSFNFTIKGDYILKQLIPMDKYGVFANSHDTVLVNSRYVADYFEKRHDHVLRDIEKITTPNSGLSEEFIKANFFKDNYKDTTGRKLKCYQLTRDGFSILAMGYTGAKAMKFKEAYIHRFDEMEEFIQTLIEARTEFPLLTENIKMIHENPKPYHFSNECDMLNRIVLGKTAKQFRLENGIENKQSIRPYLAHEELSYLDALQKVDIGLLVAIPDYNQRKRHLEWYYGKLLENDQKKIA